MNETERSYYLVDSVKASRDGTLKKFEKVRGMIFTYFTTLRVDCARLGGHRVLKIVSKGRVVIPSSKKIEGRVTHVSRFYDLLAPRNPSKNRETHSTNVF